MMKLGLIEFSLLLATVVIVLAMLLQIAVDILLYCNIHNIDLVLSIFGLIIMLCVGLFSVCYCRAT
ncbi:MAG: aerobic respiration control protein ArcB [Arsenophonus sp. NEOnobi-MAG3]